MLDALGLVATVATAGLRVRQRGALAIAPVVTRAAAGVIAFTAFGTLWIALTDMGWREQATFWPSFLGFMLFVIGLWAGRSIAIGGAAIFTLALLGYGSPATTSISGWRSRAAAR